MMLQAAFEMNYYCRLFLLLLLLLQLFSAATTLSLCLIFNWFRKQFRRALTTIKIGKKNLRKRKEHYYANNGTGPGNCILRHFVRCHFLPLILCFLFLKFYSPSLCLIVENFFSEREKFMLQCVVS